MPEVYFWSAYRRNKNGDERELYIADEVRSYSVTEASDASIYQACGFPRETGHLRIERDYDGRAYIYADGVDDYVAMIQSEADEDTEESVGI